MALRRKLGADVDNYLRELSGQLHGVPQSEVEDIVRELESHIRDILRKTSSHAEATADVLGRLGTPSDLASLYRASLAVSRAGLSPTPPRVLAAAYAWTRVSVKGAMLLVLVSAGYFLSASLLAAAVLKPFFPYRTGLWRLEDGESFSLRLGLGTTKPPGEEILGWLLIPIGLALGGLLLWVVTRYARSSLGRAKQDISDFLPPRARAAR